MSDVNFQVMLTATNGGPMYFDIIKRAIRLDACGDPRASVAWKNAALRGSRLERAAGGDLDGFDAEACGGTARAIRIN